MSNFLNFAGNSGVTFKSFTASGGTTYTLDVSSSTNSLMVSIGGVLQKPVTDYTVSGTTLTTTDTIASGIVIDTYVIHNAGGTTPIIEDNSVTTSKILNNNVTGAKIAMGSDAAGDILYYNGTDYVRLGKGTTGHYLSQGGSNAPAWAAVSAGFTQADSQATTSGTLKTFSSIPSGVKMIVVSYFDISMSGDGGAGDAIQLTLGDAGGLETSGYVSMRAQLRSSANILFDDTANFELSDHLAASSKYRGSAILTLQDVAAYRWICQWQTMDTDNAATVNVGAGSKALSAELTQVGFGTTNGFDLGSVSIMYM